LATTGAFFTGDLAAGFLAGLCDVLDAFGVDRILIETVGVGQSELEIARTADQSVVVLVPESGDSIQAMKAGLMEIADLFVVNKADRPGADRVKQDLEVMLGLRGGGLGEQPAHLGGSEADPQIFGPAQDEGPDPSGQRRRRRSPTKRVGVVIRARARPAPRPVVAQASQAVGGHDTGCPSVARRDQRQAGSVLAVAGANIHVGRGPHRNHPRQRLGEAGGVAESRAATIARGNKGGGPQSTPGTLAGPGEGGGS